MKSTEVEKIIDDTLSFCIEKFKHHGINLIVNGNVSTKIECKPTQLSQVLLNLLLNSYDSIERQNDKWIKIEVTALENHVQICLTDSGPPIEKSILHKIMVPFFTTKEVGKGTGLGLSIAKGIIEAHKGNFSYDENSPNAKFCIQLPLKQN